ncbi:Alcohol dehydrogenase GroES domain protein [Sulfolobus islandicus Y.N.15.51]|uniref:Glucose 1-dehydrogenase n=1 Tax=Saccharolobus islandicus (strain Y.N.15.51 / Yellowstone \|nr:glucose 1-dehydrogenase [Sulfolobus islandicus]ACP47762.1 Alcohol dehydrogenase GroES domain protein [Sulfolobus islandicus Y.N.15.51]
MKALVVHPPNKGVEVKEISDIDRSLNGNEVLIKTIANGICGTDRGIVSGLLKFSRPPTGKNSLVLGHENLGQVIDKGSNVQGLSKGDYVVSIVRRGCGKCSNCLAGRQDFCETGEFVEAGIRGLDGFMREFYIDNTSYLVRIPYEIVDIAVLLEPLSNVVKAYNELMLTQRRMIWWCKDGSYGCKNVAVVGSGPIGLLFSLIFSVQGFNTFVLNKRDPFPTEAEIIEKINAKFINTTKGQLPYVIDVLIDTSGYPSAFIPLMNKLNKNSAVILFGTTGGEKFEVNADLITYLVENNVLLFGSVNASKRDFEEGVNYLTIWKYRYPNVLNKMITRVVKPEEASEILYTKPRGEIKTIISWV